MNRKPIGITAPYREVGYKDPEQRLKQLEQQIKILTNRVTKLEKQNAQTEQVQTEGRTA